MSTLPAPTAKRELMVILASAFGFGLLIWFMLPAMVVAIDDDFWYLKSVVETFQRGRPWTSEYLAPWAAATSTISAIIFYVTGSMQAAVHGQLALAAGIGFLGLNLWLRDQGIRMGWRGWAAVVLLGSPTVLFMLLMFTGVALYWGCFWICVWAFGRRNWWLFFVCWALAMANRQSAIVWLALPGWFMLQEGWKNKDWKPVVLLVAAGAWFLTLKFGMNVSTAQGWVNQAAFDLSRSSGRSITLGFCVAAFAGGLGLGGILRPSSRINPWLAALAMIAGGAVALACIPNLQWTHSGYNDAWQKVYFATGGALAGLGLVSGWRVPWGGASLAALGCCTLLTLYSGKFDYYFGEMVWWGVVASLMGRKSSPEATLAPLWRWVSVAMLIAILMLNARFMVRMKLDQHRVMAFNTLYENAYRSGTLKLHETGLTTMGHLGWWLEDYYREKTGKKSGDLVGFIHMCDAWDGDDGGVSIVTELPKKFRRYGDWLPQRSSKLLLKPEAKEIGSMKMKVLGFWEATYRLKQMARKNPPQHTVEIDYAEFKGRPFPLNDEEWRKLMYGKW